MADGLTEKYENLIKECRLWYKQEKRIKSKDTMQLIWTIKGPVKNHNRFVETILKDKTVIEFEF